MAKSGTKLLRDPKRWSSDDILTLLRPSLAFVDGAALASAGGDGDAFAGGGAVFATTGVAFFTTGLAAFGRATGFAGSRPQKLNRDDNGAVSLTPPR